MSLRTKSIEGLLDLEEEFRQSMDEEKDGSLYKIVSLYEALFRKISADKEGEYAPSLPNIKKMLISYLVRYGTYLKTQYQKDDYAAEHSLKKAIQYDRENPIAHYRLGFLSYKKESYSSALVHFQNATHHQKTYSNNEYRLTNQQVYNAHLYLSNSALYIAQKAQESLLDLEGEVNLEKVPNLEMSPLYEMIKQNESYLEANAFTVITRDEEKKCSKEECEERAEGSLQDILILYFTDRYTLLLYNGKKKKLSVNHAEMLRYFFIATTEEEPATKKTFYDLFINKEENVEIPSNTFSKAVGRLKEKITQVGVRNSIIESMSLNGQPAYYCNQELPFLIMHRSDDIFLLG